MEMLLAVGGGTVDIGLHAASVTMKAFVDGKIQKVKVTAKLVEASVPTSRKRPDYSIMRRRLFNR